MKALIKTDTDKMMFQTEKGFEIVGEIQKVHNCLSETEKSCCQIEASLICAVLHLLQRVCKGFLGNVEFLCRNHPQYLTAVLNFLHSEEQSVQVASVTLLSSLLSNKFSRRLVSSVIPINKLVNSFLNEITKSPPSALKAKLETISGMLAETDVRKELVFDEQHLRHILFLLRSKEQTVIEEILNIIVSLLCLSSAQKVICSNEELFEALTNLCKVSTDDATSSVVLGLIYNLLLLNSTLVTSRFTQLKTLCKLKLAKCESLQNVLLVSRTLRVLKKILVSSEVCQEFFELKNLLEIINNLLKLFNKEVKVEEVSEACQFSSGVLAVLLKNISCTNRSMYESRVDPNLHQLVCFVVKTSRDKDEAISCANSALALSLLMECSPIPGKIAKAHVDICKDLLSVASNSPNDKVRGNVAIALSKLVSADPQQLDILRKLDGIKILHDCIKFVEV